MNITDSIASYQEWSKAIVAEMEKKDSLVDCPECNGFGEVDCDCCGREMDCEECGGEGSIPFSHVGSSRKGRLVSRSDYFNAVISDLKQYCSWTKDDFLAVAGRFVNEFRAGKI